MEEQLARDYSVDTIEDAEALLDKIDMELKEAEKAQEEYIEAADILLRSRLMTLVELQNKVVTGRARSDIAHSKASEAHDKLLELMDTLDTRRKALALLQSVASQTQEQLKQAVESAVNSSIEMLFPGYSFLVNFVPKNNKVVAELKIKKGTTELDPVASTGGGVVDAMFFVTGWVPNACRKAAYFDSRRAL